MKNLYVFITSLIFTSTVSASVFNLFSFTATGINYGFEFGKENKSGKNLLPPPPPVLTRGPYLQMGNQTSIIIRWRTDIACDSRITWGTVFGTYPNTVDSAASTTEHQVQISGLAADSKYYYTVGSTTTLLEATASNYFTTLPLSTSTRKIKVLAFGDCGNNSANQRDVRDAFISYAGTNNIEPDAWLLIGDNAYNGGLDGEYTSNFFNIYNSNLLKYLKLYPSPGNHDYNNSASNQGLRNLPYYNQFTMPTLGEVGGVASNTEAFYSYDIGDVHFVSLDSYGRENGNTTRLYDTAFGNTQADWLRNDLAANNKKWTIVYMHHPPYTKGSHNSDTESELINMHDKIPAILERFGVDLVISGHSHSYERSFLIKDLYGLSSSYVPATHLVSGSSARYNGTANSCPYNYQSGQVKHGTVYVVTGSAGQLGGTTGSLAFMSYANYIQGGSFYFEIDSNRLSAKFISYTGTGASVAPLVRDSFTIFKDVNKTTNSSVTINTPLTLTASWRGTYYWPNNAGATTQSVTINNTVNGTFNYTVRDAVSGSCIQDAFIITVSGNLPISLASFNATLNKDKVLLDWTTTQEQNNKYFTIERSNDAGNYNFLGRINGAGTSAVTHKYQLIDYSPLEGINYYRLSQTDIDGNVKYYDVKRISYSSNKNFSTGIYNKGRGQVTVSIHSTKADVINIKVVDILGKEILQENFSVNSGGGTKELNLNPGIYVLVLTNDKRERITNKIIVQ